MGLLSEKTIRLFFEKVKKTRSCWLWIAAKDNKGYGRMGIRYIRKGTIMAQRISWMIHKGPIPKGDFGHHGMCVLHKCDNPSCVNPRHLFLGTNYDNIKDMIKKGRNANGPRKLGPCDQMFKSNTSGFKGVSFDNKSKKWRAYATSEKRLYHLGFFDDPKEAFFEAKKKEKQLKTDLIRRGLR